MTGVRFTGQRASGSLVVDGLVDLQRELRRVDRELGRDLGGVNQQVAGYIVDKATIRARQLGPGFAKAAESLSAARQQRAAAVRLGGVRAPYAAGYEFGAVHNQPRQTARGTIRGWNQLPEWAGNQFTGGQAGYFLYPTIRAEAPAIVEMYGAWIDELVARAFPDAA